MPLGELGRSRPQVFWDMRKTMKSLPPFGKGGLGVSQLRVGDEKGLRHRDASQSVNTSQPRYQTAASDFMQVAEGTLPTL